MKKLILLCGFILGTLGLSFAQIVPSGTQVIITDVHPDDAYYSNKAEYIGRKGTVSGSEPLELMDSKGAYWFAGEIVFDNDDSPYFYKVSLKTPSGDVIKGEDAPVDDYVAETATNGKGADWGSTIAPGTKFTIVALSPDDSYYDSRSTYIGQSGSVGDRELRTQHDESGYWYSGPAVLDNGGSAYFFKVGLVPYDPDYVVSSPSVTEEGKIRGGSTVTILDIHADDAYVGDSEEMVGLRGTVAPEGLEESTSPGYYSGSITLENGEDPYFYKVKVKVVKVGTLSPPVIEEEEDYYYEEPVVADVMPGTRFTITDISSDDAYYGDRKKLIKQTGIVGADGLTKRTDGEKTWYSGPVELDKEGYKYFYKVAISFDEAKPSKGGKGTTITNEEDVKAGAKVTVVEISKEDAYYEDRNEIIGLTGTVDTGLSKQDDKEGVWFSGRVKFSGGSSKYFYKVKLKKAK